MRTADIELERLPDADGRERWFPVRGVTYLYHFPGPDYVDRPVGYETYKVLEGTVRFNQNLPDAFFTLDWKGAIPENEQLAIRRKEFRKPPRRYDPEGIKQHLEKASGRGGSAIETPRGVIRGARAVELDDGRASRFRGPRRGSLSWASASGDGSADDPAAWNLMRYDR